MNRLLKIFAALLLLVIVATVAAGLLAYAMTEPLSAISFSGVA